MADPLRVLCVEDSEDDTRLLVRELRKGGFEVVCERVESEAEMRDALDREPWDLVLSDHTLPNFDSRAALTLLQERGVGAPFIVVSGSIGEDFAVEMLKLGADDYLLKDRLARFVPAVQRALRQAEERRQRERAERELREKRVRMRLALQAAAVGTWSWDLESDTLVWDDDVHRLFGLAPGTFPGRPDSFLERIHPADRDRVRREMQEAIRTGKSLDTQYRIRRTDGEERILAARGKTSSRGGRSARMTGVFWDLTERRRAEQALRSSEARMAAILEIVQDAVVSVDEGGRIQLFNRGAETIFGHRAEEALGRPLDLLLPGGLAAVVSAAAAVPEAAGTQELIARRQDGTDFPAEVSLSELELDGARLITLVLRDVSERKSLEQQLLHAQKMEAIGRLAGGVAHDFNNLVTAILGYSELSLGRLPEDDPLRRNLSEIRHAAERAGLLTAQLLAFGRKQVFRPHLVDLSAVVSEMEHMLRRVIGEDVELVTELDDAPAFVVGDPGQLGQILMNLAVNARDAMPLGGRLTFATRCVELTEADLRPYPHRRPGPYVLLTVSDTGIGMDEATRERAFEPFFTTKDEGQGSGLGLSTVYGIVQQSGGMVAVVSEPERGTRFEIHLPRAKAGSVSASAPEKPATDRLEGAETLLLVEDDAAVRQLAQEVLTIRGYRVLVARDAREAQQACRAHRGPIHLMITDVVLPELSGAQLADRLEAERPEMQVLYMSGHAQESISQRLLEVPQRFLQKPFTARELAAAVREVLDGS